MIQFRMRRIHLLTAVAGFLVVAPVFANTPADWRDAIWIREQAGVLKVSASDGAPVAFIADLAGARGIAIDNARGVVWTYGPLNLLRSFDLGGVPGVSFAVPVSPLEGLTVNGQDVMPGFVPVPGVSGFRDFVSLSADQRTGDVFLAVGHYVFHFGLLDPAGTVLDHDRFAHFFSAAADDGLPSSQRGVAFVDDNEFHLWEVYGPPSNPSVTVLENAVLMRDAVFDHARNELVAVGDSTIERFSNQGLELKIESEPLSRVSCDDAAACWVIAADGRVIRFDDLDRSTADVRLFGPNSPVFVAADPRDFSAWIATAGSAAHLAVSGSRVPGSFVDPLQSIASLSFSGDVVAPLVQVSSPANGAVVRSAFPTVNVTYGDAGSGVDRAGKRGLGRERNSPGDDPDSCGHDRDDAFRGRIHAYASWSPPSPDGIHGRRRRARGDAGQSSSDERLYLCLRTDGG